MERITAIEYLRALCVLYIVGFWHLFDYTSAFSNLLFELKPITARITYTALALFVFISGYLLGSPKNKLLSPSIFLKKRLLRIVPLYFLAIFLFYLVSIDSSRTLFKAIFGVSMFHGPAPQTLWFVCMLLIFYTMTPFLLKIIDRPKIFFSLSVFLLATLITSKAYFSKIDPRIILYFPSFIIGIYCANFGFTTKSKILTIIFPSLVFGLIISTIDFGSFTLNTLKFMLFITATSYLILALCKIYELHFRHNKFVFLISYASFSMYLFHRPIFVAMQGLYYPSNPLLQTLYLIGPCLFTIFICAWITQSIYDRLLNGLNSSLKNTVTD